MMGNTITTSPLDHTYLNDFTYSVFLTNLVKAISIIKEYYVSTKYLHIELKYI